MKVYIGPYKDYISPYHIAEKLLFWKDSDSDTVYRFGERLNSIRWMRNLCQWIDSKRSRKVSVRIDNYDVWNMDSTLAYIILPMLRKLVEDKPGAPFVDPEDVPEHLRPTESNDHGTDSTWFARWEYVLNEMIFAFESVHNNWEDQFYLADNEYGWNARTAYQKRVQNGFTLFGKYFSGLWT
jgi:hypothetical protein